MALEPQIMTDLKTAMKAKDKVALEALRAIKTALLNEKTAAGAKEMVEADELKLLNKTEKATRRKCDHLSESREE